METVDDLCTGMIHRILVLSVLEKNLNHSQNNGNNSYNGNSDNNRNRYSSDNQSDNKNQAPSIRSSQTTGPSSSSKSYTSSKHTHTQEMKATQSITVTSLVAHWLVELRYPIRSYNQLKQNSCIVLSSCIVLYCIVLYCIVLYCISTSFPHLILRYFPYLLPLCLYPLPLFVPCKIQKFRVLSI